MNAILSLGSEGMKLSGYVSFAPDTFARDAIIYFGDERIKVHSRSNPRYFGFKQTSRKQKRRARLQKLSSGARN